MSTKKDIHFGIIIIMNSETAKDSALKCFVFFLISQPLVYLIQIPFSDLGWQLFNYYKYWFLWTILTLPMGYIGWYMKKDKWWGLCILSPIIVLLGFHISTYLGQTIFSFPRHLLTALFCVITILIYPIAIFKNKSIRIAGLIISIVTVVISCLVTILNPLKYETEVLVNNGSAGAVFDDSYSVYLSNDSLGTVEIRFLEQGLEDWVVHAVFTKAGQTDIILKSPEGDEQVFTIDIARNTYNIERADGIEPVDN